MLNWCQANSPSVYIPSRIFENARWTLISRPTVFFCSKVAIIKTKRATIDFFSSPPFLLGFEKLAF